MWCILTESQEHQAVETQEQDQFGTTEEIKDQNQSEEQMEISESVEPVKTQDQNQSEVPEDEKRSEEPVETIEPEVVPQSDQPVTTGALEGATATSGGQMSAVVIGCTGAIGRCLVGVLLQDKVSLSKLCYLDKEMMMFLCHKYMYH